GTPFGHPPGRFRPAASAFSPLPPAAGLDGLARHTHNRSERFRTAGFVFRAEHDYWVCPEDQMLWPHSYDTEQRIVRYRATPHICNACPSKHRCTTSELGREIVRPIDPWPHSEAGRFHRVVALVLVALAGLLTIIELIRWHDPAEVSVLAGAAALTALTGWWLTGHLRATPANFPQPSPAHSLRFTAR